MRLRWLKSLGALIASCAIAMIALASPALADEQLRELEPARRRHLPGQRLALRQLLARL